MIPELLPKAQLQSTSAADTAGGLVVVGSFVPKTSAQLSHLLHHLDVTSVEMDAAQLISFLPDDNHTHISDPNQQYAEERESYQQFIQSHPAADEYFAELVSELLEVIKSKKENAVLYTSRSFVPNATIYETGFVSYCLTEVVHRLHVERNVTPSFIVAKGGITSHEVAQYGLGITTARVLGQVAAGVPVWQYYDPHGAECKYVVFPGNVGDEKTLTQVVMDLGAKRKPSLLPSPLFLQPRRDNLVVDAKSLLAELRTAFMQQRALTAFNVYNLEGAKAVMQPAQRLHSPAMIQVHPASIRYGGRPLLNMLRSIKESASVPLFIHLDHCDDEADLDLALSMECLSSVMIDGSALPFEQNMQWTKRLAEKARQCGVLVEAELGKLAGEEDGLSIPEKDAKMTDPDLAAEFVYETDVDLLALAVTIGNVHGKYALPPNLDFDRLKLIREKVAARNSNYVPLLVLHGASGLSSELIQRAIQEGIVKFNVNTDMRNAALDYYQAELCDSGEKRKNMLPLMQGATEAMSE